MLIGYKIINTFVKFFISNFCTISLHNYAYNGSIDLFSLHFLKSFPKSRGKGQVSAC